MVNMFTWSFLPFAVNVVENLCFVCVLPVGKSVYIVLDDKALMFFCVNAAMLD